MSGIELTLTLAVALIGLVVLASILMLNSGYVPQPIDEAMKLEDSVTKTADYNGASYDFGALFAPGGVGQVMAGVVEITAMDKTTGDETYAFTLEESADNATFTACGPKVTLTAVGTYSVPGFISQRYSRLALDVGGTTPSITYKSWVSPNAHTG